MTFDLSMHVCGLTITSENGLSVFFVNEICFFLFGWFVVVVVLMMIHL